jgi:recombinational DNA repair protein (RecF pathway)
MTKSQCRSKTNSLIRQGVIVRPDACMACGKVGPLETHHDDYTDPAKVRFLCHDCHSEADRKRIQPEIPSGVGQIYIRAEDYERLKAWADAEKRHISAQLTVLLDCYAAHRPALKTLKPLKKRKT